MVTPAFDAYVVPLTVLVLVILFAVQSRGTARVASFFGPVTLFWFATIAAAGIWHVGQNLSVLLAFNPWYGVSFLLHHGIVGFYTLGAVFLVVTGAEALYADLGHFGRGPIRFAWLVVVLPALLAQLSRAGRAYYCRSEIGREPVLSALPGLGAASDGTCSPRRRP